MTKQDQKRIAREMSDRFKQRLLAVVSHQSFQKDWDGHFIAAYARRFGGSFGGSDSTKKNTERILKQSQAFYELPE